MKREFQSVKWIHSFWDALGLETVAVFKGSLAHDFEKKFLGSEVACVSFTSKNEISLRSSGVLFNHNLFFFLPFFLRCTSVFRLVKSFSFLYSRYPLKYWLEVGLNCKAPDHSPSLPKPCGWGPAHEVPTLVNLPDLSQIAIRDLFKLILTTTLVALYGGENRQTKSTLPLIRESWRQKIKNLNICEQVKNSDRTPKLCFCFFFCFSEGVQNPLKVLCGPQTQSLCLHSWGKPRDHSMVGDFLANLSMSAQTSPAEKGLNPGLMCQESYACSGTDEAVFECDECCSLQCLRCEEELHRQERLRNHERIRLKPGHVPYCDPCKGTNGHSPGVRQRAAVRCQTCKINLCLECQKRTHSGGNKRRHPVTVYHVTKVQGLLEEDELDEETRRKKMTEKVVSFLLVDENEEIQVSEPVGEVGVLWLSRGALVGRELLLEGSSRKEKSKKSSRFDGSGARPRKA